MDSDPISLAATNGAGERLDRFLARTLPDYSRARLQRWIALGAVSCDTRAISAKTRLTGQETIVVEPQPLEADQAFVPEPVDFEVLHEDHQLIVVNKPVGVVVHPGAGNWHGTLMNGLLHRYAGQADLPRAGIVHRLDKGTSGLLVVARTEAVREALIGQLSARTLNRQYLAVCHGHLATDTLSAGTTDRQRALDGAIGRDRNNRLRMSVRRDGKPALTTVQCLQAGSIDDHLITLVHCRLHTGRTHQIRVHLAAADHPLVGDTTYGGRQLAGLTRQALHAFALGLTHPAGGDNGPWVCPPPPDLQALLHAAQFSAPDYRALSAA